MPHQEPQTLAPSPPSLSPLLSTHQHPGPQPTKPQSQLHTPGPGCPSDSTMNTHLALGWPSGILCRAQATSEDPLLARLAAGVCSTSPWAGPCARAFLLLRDAHRTACWMQAVQRLSQHCASSFQHAHVGGVGTNQHANLGCFGR